MTADDRHRKVLIRLSSSERLIFTFAFATLALMVVVVHLLPLALNLSVSAWTQYLAYAGGFLLAAQMLGDRRIEAVDQRLSSRAKHISGVFCIFVLTILLVRKEKNNHRREIATWYILGALELALMLVLLFATFPWLGIDSAQLLDRVTWYHVLVTSLGISLGPLAMLYLDEFVSFLWYRLTGKRIQLGGFMPIIEFFLALFAWVTFVWLFWVVLTWAVLQSLLLVVRAKTRLRLGNVLYVFGGIMLAASFGLFLYDQIQLP